MKVLIIGLARSGVGAAKLCVGKGFETVIYDAKSAEELGDKLAQLEGVNAETVFGREMTDEELGSFDRVILSPGVPPTIPMVEKARELGAEIMGEVELAYRYSSAPVIGITGTNGKTTTTALCEAILKSVWPGSVAAGNIGLAFSEVAEEIGAPNRIALELSSFQLETTIAFHPHISAMLNITPDHLNRHKTMEGYIGAKMKVFANQTAGDFAVLNALDPYCREMAKELTAREDGPEVIFFSRNEKPEKGVWTEGDKILSNLDGETEEIAEISKMKIFGAHNEENALAAIACCLLTGVKPEEIKAPLYEFAGVEHRIEYVAEVNGVRYYNDSKATNPDSAVKGLLAMKSPTVLIGGGMDKKIPFNEWCRLFDGRVRKLVLFGETKQLIYDTALEEGFPAEKMLIVDTLEEAVKACYEAAEEGDNVLLSPACASWDMFESYEQRGHIFKDLVHELELQ